MRVICHGYVGRDRRIVSCGRALGEKPDPISWDRETQGEPISHGLCPTCAAEAEQIEVEDQAREED